MKGASDYFLLVATSDEQESSQSNEGYTSNPTDNTPNHRTLAAASWSIAGCRFVWRLGRLSGVSIGGVLIRVLLRSEDERKVSGESTNWLF